MQLITLSENNFVLPALAERLLAFCLLEGHVQGTTMERIGGRLRNNDAEGIVQMVHMDNGVGRDGRPAPPPFDGGGLHPTLHFWSRPVRRSRTYLRRTSPTSGWLAQLSTSHLYLVSHVSPCCKHFALYLIPNHRWFVCQYSLIVSRQSPTPRSAARGRSSSALRPRSLSNSSSRCSNTVSFLMNLPFMFGIGIERNWR